MAVSLPFFTIILTPPPEIFLMVSINSFSSGVTVTISFLSIVLPSFSPCQNKKDYDKIVTARINWQSHSLLIGSPPTRNRIMQVSWLTNHRLLPPFPKLTCPPDIQFSVGGFAVERDSSFTVAGPCRTLTCFPLSSSLRGEHKTLYLIILRQIVRKSTLFKTT